MTTSIRHMSFVRGQKARLPELTMEIPMSRFADMLRTHRFDDYRYDHQGRINETTPHLISAIFLGCYALLFEEPVRRARPSARLRPPRRNGLALHRNWRWPVRHDPIVFDRDLLEGGSPGVQGPD
jgi:hypothetical protein